MDCSGSREAEIRYSLGEKWVTAVRVGKKNTKQSTVFNPFSPSRLFRVKGEAGYSLLFPPGEEGIGEQHGAWGMGRTLKRVGGGEGMRKGPGVGRRDAEEGATWRRLSSL